MSNPNTCAIGVLYWQSAENVLNYCDNQCTATSLKTCNPMFSSLSTKFTDIFSRLKKRGALTEADIDAVMREVRIALLEADVALPVVKDFVASLKTKALGAEVIKSVSPAQMVIKLTSDHLAELLGR